MSFWGSSFVFDGVPSETYRLFISSSEDGGDVEVTGSSNVETFTETIFRKSTRYLLGVQKTPVLEFDVSFNSPDEINAVDIRYIQGWLFGHNEYKKLLIMQPDMQDVYYNCFLKNPRINKNGNLIVGVRATVECDAPWAWAFERSSTYNFSGDDVNENIVFYNESDDNGYLYPKIQFTVSDLGGNVTITNNSDNGRQFIFTDLSSDEIITVDNLRNIVTTSKAIRRIANFNKKWFRMPRGRNEINISGNISQLIMTYKFARKVN